MVKDSIINQIPITIANDVVKAKQLLRSQTSTMEISKRTHINHATIYRLRHHTRNFGSITINTCWKLANYPVQKPLNYQNLNTIFTQTINSIHNISALSRQAQISRITIQRLSLHKNNLKKMNIITVVKLLNLWSNIQKETINATKK